MKEKKEDRVRKIFSQARISTRVRSSEDHKVLIILLLRDQLRLSVVRLFDRHRQFQVHQGVLQEDRLLLIAHIMGGNIKESVGD